MESIQGAPFQKMCADVATPLSLGTTSFGPVTDFLQGAGQSQIVSQVYLLTYTYLLKLWAHTVLYMYYFILAGALILYNSNSSPY